MTSTLKYLCVALILVCLGAGAYAVHSYRQMTERVVTLEATAQKYDDLSKRFDTFTAEVASRRITDNTVRSNRARITQTLEQTAREDKPTADFLTAPIPRGVRESFRKTNDQ